MYRGDGRFQTIRPQDRKSCTSPKEEQRTTCGVRRFRCKFSGIWAPWVLWSWFCPGKNQPVLRQTKTPPAVGRKPTTTDVQHSAESAPQQWTALQRPATPARASVEVRNETAKAGYAGGDSRERPATSHPPCCGRSPRLPDSGCLLTGL